MEHIDENIKNHQEQKEVLLKSFISRENNYPCSGFCSSCVFKDIHGTVAGCNPASFKGTIDEFIEVNMEWA